LQSFCAMCNIKDNLKRSCLEHFTRPLLHNWLQEQKWVLLPWEAFWECTILVTPVQKANNYTGSSIQFWTTAIQSYLKIQFSFVLVLQKTQSIQNKAHKFLKKFDYIWLRFPFLESRDGRSVMWNLRKPPCGVFT